MTRARRLIVTADDFGLAEPVNAAVERAHRDGILTSASLMVTAPAAADAIARARRTPSLAVGLHLVLADGVPALDTASIPALVGRDGRFPASPLAAGVAIFCRPGARAQLEREVRAQLERFMATGLPLDHVDAHHHLHIHPTVRRCLIRIAREYGIRAMRLPREPAYPAWRAARDRAFARGFGALAHGARLARMRRELDAAGIACNDWMFGLNDAGRMTGARIAAQFARLPDGVTELCLHIATQPWQGSDAWPQDFACVEEYAALLDRHIADLIDRRGIARAAFRDLEPARRAA
jgi:hopanoid biosynthesis associated protein HpnK